MKPSQMQNLITFLKSRGFVYPSSEIYGGLAGVYDYGPLGVELLNNLKKLWWQDVVYKNKSVYGLDGAIFQSPLVWQASGHTDNFSDALIECKKCNSRFRDDELKERICLNCGGQDFADKRNFNLLIESNLGSLSGKNNNPVFLRAETCQAIYLNFKNIVNSFSPKLPFGVAQIGKAFRNEINPRKFLFRTREFEQAEAQYFCLEKEAMEKFNQEKENRMNFLLSLGLKKENLRIAEHENLVFYARAAIDIEYNFPEYGFSELEGVHHRGDYDLSCHQKASKIELTYFNQERGEKILPIVIETSIGLGRLFLAILSDAFIEEKLADGSSRTILKLNKKIAPYKIAILPLMKKDNLPEKANEIFDFLKDKYSICYDASGSIGKRYRRQDEIGTPYCLTIGYELLEKNRLTIRDRDSMKQWEIDANFDALEDFFKKNL